jgi:hypothetical protein
VTGITNSLFPLVSFLPARPYNVGTYDVIASTLRVSHLSVFDGAASDSGRASWIAASRLELRIMPRKEDDGEVGAFGDGIPVRRLPRHLNSRRYDGGVSIHAEK